MFFSVSADIHDAFRLSRMSAVLPRSAMLLPLAHRTKATKTIPLSPSSSDLFATRRKASSTVGATPSFFRHSNVQLEPSSSASCGTSTIRSSPMQDLRSHAICLLTILSALNPTSLTQATRDFRHVGIAVCKRADDPTGFQISGHQCAKRHYQVVCGCRSR